MCPCSIFLFIICISLFFFSHWCPMDTCLYHPSHLSLLEFVCTWQLDGCSISPLISWQHIPFVYPFLIFTYFWKQNIFISFSCIKPKVTCSVQCSGAESYLQLQSPSSLLSCQLIMNINLQTSEIIVQVKFYFMVGLLIFHRLMKRVRLGQFVIYPNFIHYELCKLFITII